MSNSLFQRYAQLSVHQRFAALSQREKLLAILAAAVLILFAGYTFVVEPVIKDIAKIERSLARKASELERQQLQLELLQQELKSDPNQLLSAQSTRLSERIAHLNTQFASQLRDLVPARQMPVVLQRLLSGASKLTLLEMKSIAPVNVLLKQNQAQDASESEAIAERQTKAADLYQHGVLLVLEGSYFDVQNYLLALQALDWRFYWKRFDYSVQDYPIARIEIELFTLSTNKAFIGV